MVFVKRKEKNNTENNIEENFGEVKPPKFSSIEIKTFKEQAKEVLNILDSKGIDIYDKNRYGGMYLKNKKNISKNEISNIFKSEDSKDESKNDLTNLFKHFNNSK